MLTSVKSRLVTAFAIGLFSISTQAASISYFLDQSDKMSDGTNYLQVTIADGVDGAIKFTVQALQPLLDIAGDKFGITKFAFNAVEGIPLKRWNVDLGDLPNGWRKSKNGNMDIFGKYDMRLKLTRAKAPRSDTIEFLVDGIDFDELASYVDFARKSDAGPSLFAARVAGLNLPCADRKSPSSSNRRSFRSGGGCKPTDAFFGGGSFVPTAVPAPPAVWLLGTAVAGLVVRRFRRG